MKKITLSFFLLISLLGFSQQQQYSLGFEPSTPSGTVSNWVSFENPNPVVSIVPNPDPDGVNNSASTNVMKVDFTQASACYAGIINNHGTFGTWRFDTSVPSNITVSMQVNKSIAGKVGIKFITPTNGTVIEVTSNEGLVSTLNQWVTLSWNISGLNTAEQNAPSSVDQFVIFVDFTCGGPDRAAGGTLLIDNVTWNANKITNPATCTDGIQNGSETGIDCGGTACAPCPGQEPLVAAPTPPARNAADVVSIFSGAYANVTLSELPTAWSNLGSFTTPSIVGNPTWKITGLDFMGIVTNYATGENLSTMEKMHIDYWTPSTNGIEVKIVNTVTNPVTEAVTSLGTTVTGSWQSKDIDMSAFSALSNKNTITQILIDATGAGTSTLFIDNFYFYKGLPLNNTSFEVSKIKMYPNPTKNTFTVEAKNNIQNIEVLNMLGQQILFSNPNSVSTLVDLTAFQDGIYIIKTTVDGNVTTSKIIKE